MGNKHRLESRPWGPWQLKQQRHVGGPVPCRPPGQGAPGQGALSPTWGVHGPLSFTPAQEAWQQMAPCCP